MAYVKKSVLGTIFLMITAFIWGVSFIAQVLGSDQIPPFGFNGLRFLLGGIAILPLTLMTERYSPTTEEGLAKRKRMKQHTFLMSLVAGLFLFVASALQQYGISLTRDPGKAAFITGLYIALTPIGYRVFFKQRSSVNTWIGCMVAVAGLFLIFYKDILSDNGNVGDLFLLAGAVMWTAHILSIYRFGGHVLPFRFSVYQYFVAGSLSLILSLFTERMTLTGIMDGLGAVLICGLLSVGVAYTLQTIGQQMVSPPYAAILLSTETVFATLGGLFWNAIAPEHLRVGQTLSALGFIGCGLMFLGIIISQVKFSKRKKTP